MKKSSFLHKPKDMLSKSFNPAKCKTSLKLATSRMKLLKNKKEVQIKQMKRELAQLLESGQDQTARIRVEHVIREEKMMAAYDLLDIYCELIVARLPIIETQKDCPIDLKEAIASVIFASPRCGDVPELLDARKYINAKYGKDFVSAALELRPNCGVSRLLVEKLSANAPDGQTKIKSLKKIAEEHNIKWDAESSEQNGFLPPDDLLNGPKNFEKASMVLPEAPAYVTPNFQAPPSHATTDNQPSNFSQESVRTSPGTQSFVSRHNSPSVQQRPSGVEQEKVQAGQSYQGDGSSSSTGQHWNMEFKDATAAARAAAESAEHASMAARAAAELSSHAQTAAQPQYFSEAHNSIGDDRSDETTGKQATSKHSSDYMPQDSARSSVEDGQPRFQNKPMDRIVQENRDRLSERSYKDGHDRGKEYGHIASSRSRPSVEDETLTHSGQVPDVSSWKSLSKEEEQKFESRMRRQYVKYETEGANYLREGFSSEKFDYSGEDMIRKQSSIPDSRYHSSTTDSNDEFSDSSHKTFGYDAGNAPFLGDDEERNARDTLPSSYHNAAAPVVFDDSGSDREDIESYTGFKSDEELNFHFSSVGRNSASNLPINIGNGSHVSRTVESPDDALSEIATKKHSFEFSESLEEAKDSSPADNFGPVTFDDSDGASSESEIDILHSAHGGTEDSRNSPIRQNQSVEVSDSKIRRNDSQKTDSVVSFGDAPMSPPSLGLGKSQRESGSASRKSSFHNSVDEAVSPDFSESKVSFAHEDKNIGSASLHGSHIDDENSDDGKALNFKRLTGGFRQKGYSRPPYLWNQSDETSSSSQRVSKEGPTTFRQSAVAATTNEEFANTGKDTNKGNVANTGKDTKKGNFRSARVPNYYSDSDGDSSVEELQKHPTSLRKKPDIHDAGKDAKIQSSLRGSATYFDSQDSDSEDDSAKKVLTGKSHLGSGFSRRTKPTPPSSTSVSVPKAGSGSRLLVNSDSGSERTTTTRVYGIETPQEPMSRNRNSDQLQKSEQRSSARVADKPGSASQKIGSHLENRNSYTRETPPASGERNVEKSEGFGSQKSASGITMNREDSLKNASHVHPKLPDYDTIAARLQALRTSRE